MKFSTFDFQSEEVVRDCWKQIPLQNLFFREKSVQVETLPRKMANLTTIPSCWNSPQKAQRQRRGIWRLCETLGETQDYYSDTFDNMFKLSNVLLQSKVRLSEKYFPRMLLRWALRCFGRSGSRILMFTTGRSPTCTPSPLRTGGFWRRSRKWNDALFLKICSLVSKWQGSLLTEIDDKVDRWNFFLFERIEVVVYCLRIVVLVYCLRMVVLIFVYSRTS